MSTHLKRKAKIPCLWKDTEPYIPISKERDLTALSVKIAPRMHTASDRVPRLVDGLNNALEIHLSVTRVSRDFVTYLDIRVAPHVSIIGW